MNTGGAHYSQAPESSFFAFGAGQNIIWIEPLHNLVMVARWIDAKKTNDLVGHVMAAVV